MFWKLHWSSDKKKFSLANFVYIISILKNLAKAVNHRHIYCEIVPLPGFRFVGDYY